MVKFFKGFRNILILVAVSVAVFTLFISHVGLSEFTEAVQNSNKPLLFIALTIQFSIILIITMRWRYLLELVGNRIPIRNLYLINVSGNFFNNITPGARVGGEGLRIYLLNKKYNVVVREGLATVVVERTFDFIVLFAFFIFSYLYLNFTGEVTGSENEFLRGILFITFLIIIVAAILLKNEYLLSKVLDRIPKGLGKKIEEIIRIFSTNSTTLIREKGISNAMLFFTLLIWIGEVLRTFVVFTSLGISVPLVGVAVVTTIVMFLSAIPIAPGGLGVAEGSMLLGYAALGVPSEISAVAIIIDRMISYWLVTLIGGVATFGIGIEI